MRDFSSIPKVVLFPNAGFMGRSLGNGILTVKYFPGSWAQLTAETVVPAVVRAAEGKYFGKMIGPVKVTAVEDFCVYFRLYYVGWVMKKMHPV